MRNIRSKYQSLVAILLLAIFLSPYVVKSNHHHSSEGENLSAKILSYHHKCPICQYEFSSFEDVVLNYDPSPIAFFVCGVMHNETGNLLFGEQYRFSLRAPPTAWITDVL